MTVTQALRYGAELLRGTGVQTPRTDAELLLGKVVGAGRTELYTEGRRPLTPGEQAAYDQLLERRARREPLAYVLGEWGFRRLTLAVDSRVLVPRPETEVVVERCLDLLSDIAEPSVLDVGTGSGAIALALVDEHPGARLTAVDSSAAALEVARANAAAAGLERRVRFVEADFRAGLEPAAYDLVVSNPPYVLPGEIETLEPEVRDWEPRAALVGDGVAAEIAAASRAVLRERGWLVLEAADGRARELAGELEGLGYRTVRVTQDLADVERVVEGRWQSSKS